MAKWSSRSRDMENDNKLENLTHVYVDYMNDPSRMKLLERAFALMRKDFPLDELESLKTSKESNQAVKDSGRGERGVYVSLNARGEVVAAALVATFYESGCNILENISTRKDLRRRGIARALNNAAMELSSERSIASGHGPIDMTLIEVTDEFKCDDPEQKAYARGLSKFYPSIGAKPVGGNTYIQPPLEYDENGNPVTDPLTYLTLWAVSRNGAEKITSKRLASAVNDLCELSYGLDMKKTHYQQDFIQSMGGEKTCPLIEPEKWEDFSKVQSFGKERKTVNIGLKTVPRQENGSQKFMPEKPRDL